MTSVGPVLTGIYLAPVAYVTLSYRVVCLWLVVFYFLLTFLAISNYLIPINCGCVINPSNCSGSYITMDMRSMWNPLSWANLQHINVSTEVLCGWAIYIMRCYDYFLHFLLYLFNGRCFYDQYINKNIIYNAPSPTFQTLLIRCSCFIFVTCYIYLLHFCYTLEMCVEWVQVIIETLTYIFLPCVI